MQKNAEKMDLSSRNRLLRVPAGSHGFWAHDPLPDPSHDPDVDPRRVTIPLAFTNSESYELIQHLLLKQGKSKQRELKGPKGYIRRWKVSHREEKDVSQHRGQVE